MSQENVTIVGTGLAGFQVAAVLRELQFSGRVVLIGEEPHPPYHRPPLSKAFLVGATEEPKLAMRPQTFYVDKHIELITGKRAVAIDRAHRKLALEDDSVTEYDHLVLATGARNRPLPVPGVELGGVHFLRTVDEARVLRTSLPHVRKVVVIGAGFIGLEFAASALKYGVEVTVLEVADRPMARVLSASMSAVFAREMARMGVRFLFNTQVMRVVGDAATVTGVETVEGQVVPCDLVLIGIGVIPNVDLAATCGLDIQNGIVVDEQLRTADPNISAVGDCAAHPSVHAQAAVRIESVQNATDQGRCVASRIAGRATRFTAVPWFWSDQGELKLQIAGLTAGFDRTVLRGDPASTSCAVFCYRGERLLGVETVNRPADHMMARRLIAAHVRVTPEQAADERFDLKQLVPPAAAG